MSVSFLTGEELYKNEGKNMFFAYLLQKHCNANCSNQLSLYSQVAQPIWTSQVRQGPGQVLQLTWTWTQVRLGLGSPTHLLPRASGLADLWVGEPDSIGQQYLVSALVIFHSGV